MLALAHVQNIVVITIHPFPLMYVLAGLGKINGDVAGFGHVLAVAHLWWWKVRGVGVMNGMIGRKRQGRRVKALVQARQREKNYIC